MTSIEPLYKIDDIAAMLGRSKAFVYRCKETGLLQCMYDKPVIATESMVRACFESLKDPDNRKKIADLYRAPKMHAKRGPGRPAGSRNIRDIRTGKSVADEGVQGA